MSTAPATTLHASCVLVGEAGVLLTGPSGSGKSTLALALVDEAARRGSYAMLVGDDRMRLARHGDRLVARPVAAIAGLVEYRGLGLLPRPHAEAAVVRAVIACGETPQRLPEPEALEVELLGLRLPRLFAARDTAFLAIALGYIGGLSVTKVP